MVDSHTPPTSEEAPIKDDKCWTSGDIALISADNVRFRVAGITLAWSSPVFAGMLSLPSKSEDTTIHLLDSTMETSDVIHAYLDLVSANFERLKIFHEKPEKWSALLVQLTKFLDKYGSERGLTLLRTFGTNTFALRRFTSYGDIVFASRLNDLALCFRILAERNGPYRASSGSNPLDVIASRWKLSLGHESFVVASAIPFPYQWAIARAAALGSPTSVPEAFAHDVVRLVKEMHEQGRCFETADTHHQGS